MPVPFVCRDCDRALAFDPDGFARCCGTSIARDGPIHNAYDSRAYIFDAVTDRRIAGLLANTYANLPPHDLGPTLTIDAADRIALSAGLTAAELAKLKFRTQFLQLSRDLYDYAFDTCQHDDIVSYFRSHIRPQPPTRLLDIGCSTGTAMLSFAPLRHELTVGLDIDALALHAGAAAWALRHGSVAPVWLAADLLAMPLAPRCFDHVMSSVVLAVVPMRAALREIHRVLDDGGTLTLTIEGHGFWDELWEQAASAKEKLGLARWRIGRFLMEQGVEWQGRPGIRRLAGYTTWSPELLRARLEQSGFAIRDLTVLREHRAVPRLIGVHAEKVASSRSDARSA